MILENLHDASKQLEGKNYPAACDVILLIDKIHSDLNLEEIKYHGKLKFHPKSEEEPEETKQVLGEQIQEYLALELCNVCASFLPATLGGNR